MGPALRSVLAVLFSAYFRFSRFFKQKKQNYSFPDENRSDETKFQ